MKSIYLLFFLLVLPMHAAKPPDWLTIPAAGEPKPTGTSAWILQDSVRLVHESGSTIRYRYRQAVMPLSRAAVKTLSCNVQFTSGTEEIVSARAWAMSPDGKQCRAFSLSEFLVYSPTISRWMWDLEKTAYFDPERYLEPGWIFAWEVEIKSNYGLFDFRWAPVRQFPSKLALMEVVPVPGGEIKWKAFSADVPAPVPGSTAGSLVWRFANLPAFSHEIPTGAALNPGGLGVYVLDPAVPASRAKSWSDVVRLVRAEMDPCSITSPAVETETHRLTGDGDFWRRIEPVCRFVQKEIVYLAVTIKTDSMAGFRPHVATDVFGNRYGDCKDKAVLLCTMLRSMGVEARVLLVNNGEPRRTVADWPSVFFNHAIVAIRVNQPTPAGWTTVRVANLDYVLFDPTDDRVPLGLLPTSDTGGYALLLADGVTAPVMIPAVPSPSDSKIVNIKAVLAEDGSATFDLAEEFSGLTAAAAITFDETSSQTERAGTLERRIQRTVPLMADLRWESASDTPNYRWNRTAHFTGQFLGKRIPGGMCVSSSLLSVVPSVEPWEENSDGWINFPPQTTRGEMRISLPSGWTPIEIPPDWSVKTAAGEGTVHYEFGDGVLVGKIRVKVEGGVLDRPAYMELRSLIYSANAAEHRPISLRRVAALTPAVAPASAKN